MSQIQWGLSCDHNSGLDLLSVLVIFTFSCNTQPLVWRKRMMGICLIEKTSEGSRSGSILSPGTHWALSSNMSSYQPPLSLSVKLLRAHLGNAPGSRRQWNPHKRLNLWPLLKAGRMQRQLFLFSVLKCSAAHFSFSLADIAPLILTSDGENYAAVVGYSAFLHCEIFASPAADVRW